MTKRNSKKYDTTIEKKKKPQIINSMQQYSKTAKQTKTLHN